MDRIQHAIIITPRAGTIMPPQEIEQSAEQKKSVADRKLITPPIAESRSGAEGRTEPRKPQTSINMSKRDSLIKV